MLDGSAAYSKDPAMKSVDDEKQAVGSEPMQGEPMSLEGEAERLELPMKLKPTDVSSTSENQLVSLCLGYLLRTSVLPFDRCSRFHCSLV
jgi:hypothetical protein